MPDDYAYINTRVRIMRTELLSGHALDSALAAGSYQEFLRVLAETDFAPQLREATAEGAGLTELDRALSNNLFATTQKVLGFADGDAKSEIQVLLMRWDLANLRSIARGIVNARGLEAILASLISGGTLKPSVLQTAAASPDLASAAAAITVSGHPLARTMQNAALAFSASNKLLDFEVALDQGYYLYALRVARDTSLRRYLAREIDVTNALLTRSSAEGQVPSPNLFVPGGRLAAADFSRLAAGDSGGVQEIEPILTSPTLQAAEIAARAVLDRAAQAASASDPQGVGVIIDFLRRKQLEIGKLRLIGRGKYYGLPAEQIRHEVQA